MKTNNALTLFLLSLLILSGCGTSHITMEVLQPAEITLPEDIKTLALVNRFQPQKGKGFGNFLEGALTGEAIGQDRNGADASLAGLTHTLSGSPRFRIIRPAVQLEGHGRASFPEPLSPAQVRELCARYNADALVTIEAFDSDGSRNCQRRTRNIKRDGQTITEVFYEAEQVLNVTVGWRLYAAETGTLIDEVRMRENLVWDADGPTEVGAFNNLPPAQMMVQDMGAMTGSHYSQRIAPIFINISRSYYSGGTPALKLGRDDVRRNQWEEAEGHWNIAMKNEKDKIKGRALYNKALAAEIRGDLVMARDLAVEAYEKYRNKRARRYSMELTQRIYDLGRLDEQMQGAPQ